VTPQSLSAAQARRLALSAQALGKRPDRPASRQSLLKLIARLGVVQLDSVNVVSRSHYLPLFSRAGDYDRSLLDELAWGKRPALIEYWAHEASLILPGTHPLLRWRMDDARAGKGVWKGVARLFHERRDLIDAVRDQVADLGSLAASEITLGEKGAGGWWGWSEAKHACECLFWAGEFTSVTRRGNFERVYGLSALHLPEVVINTPTPDREAAQRGLLRMAADAMGVATERDLRDYFRMGPAESRAGIAALVEAGELEPVAVEGWREPAYVIADASIPRRVSGDSLLSPFDNLIWCRERTERLFGVRVRLEIYTPADKRLHGYYVLPFLQGDVITARVDLKADRKEGVLLVQAAHAEPGATADTPGRLAAELNLMARWLGLVGVRIVGPGDLAPALAAALTPIS
jgi:uncharacterized protein YcaQ